MRLMNSEFLSFVPSVLLQTDEGKAVTPAFAGTGVFLLLVLGGLLLILILREKVKDRRRQGPTISDNFIRQAPPLPAKRASKGPPELPRRR